MALKEKFTDPCLGRLWFLGYLFSSSLYCFYFYTNILGVNVRRQEETKKTLRKTRRDQVKDNGALE